MLCNFSHGYIEPTIYRQIQRHYQMRFRHIYLIERVTTKPGIALGTSSGIPRQCTKLRRPYLYPYVLQNMFERIRFMFHCLLFGFFFSYVTSETFTLQQDTDASCKSLEFVDSLLLSWSEVLLTIFSFIAVYKIVGLYPMKLLIEFVRVSIWIYVELSINFPLCKVSNNI